MLNQHHQGRIVLRLPAVLDLKARQLEFSGGHAQGQIDQALNVLRIGRRQLGIGVPRLQGGARTLALRAQLGHQVLLLR